MIFSVPTNFPPAGSDEQGELNYILVCVFKQIVFYLSLFLNNFSAQKTMELDLLQIALIRASACFGRAAQAPLQPPQKNTGLRHSLITGLRHCLVLEMSSSSGEAAHDHGQHAAVVQPPHSPEAEGATGGSSREQMFRIFRVEFPGHCRCYSHDNLPPPHACHRCFSPLLPIPMTPWRLLPVLRCSAHVC